MNCPDRGARQKRQVRLLGSIACLIIAACGSAAPGGPQTPADGSGFASQDSARSKAYALDESPLPPEFEVTEKIKIVTSMGEIVVGIFGKQAPKTVENFLQYVDSGFYTDKIFHRVIEGFMIQGGGFDSGLQRAETRPPIELEIIPGLRHEVGIVSMARTSDPHSATSQFFICVGVAPQLNGTYAAFGKVEEGQDVVTAISKVSTETLDTVMGPMSDVPVDPVVIKSITRLGF